MSGIVAQLYPIDKGNDHLRRNVALRFDPFPGDIIELADGLVLRVTRRRLVEIVGDNLVDVRVEVREEANG